MVMTREEAMLKLLAVEPETKDGLIRATGWPVDETLAVLRRLRIQGRVTYGAGPYSSGGVRVYYPTPPRETPRIVRLARVAEEERRIRQVLRPKWTSAANR